MTSFLKTYVIVLLAVALIAALANFGLEKAVTFRDQTTVIECPANGTPLAATGLKVLPVSHKIHVITLVVPSA